MSEGQDLKLKLGPCPKPCSDHGEPISQGITHALSLRRFAQMPGILWRMEFSGMTTANVVKNKTLPMMAKNLRLARDTEGGWQDDSADAQDFRLQVGELHRHLQQCIIEGRKGRVCFETVDIGANTKKDEHETKWKRTFRCRRDYPNKGEVHLEISPSKTVSAFLLTLPTNDRRTLEDDLTFRALRNEQRALL